VYRNAGTTRQNGLEAFLTFNGPGDSQSNFRYQFNASGAIQDYRFSDYIKDSTDLSGNKLPGAPQATFSGSGSLQFKRRIDLLLSGRYNGRTWANDENTVAQEGYWLFDGQLSWHIYAENPAVYEPHPTPMITILVGMNNILDQQYTNFLALNAFGGRYWNPAPGRNVFGGVQFRF
jgi:iron complex outermembrane receptor protein